MSIRLRPVCADVVARCRVVPCSATRGVKEALRKRLKAHYKRLRLARLQSACSAPGAAPGRAPRIPFVLVIDFEATCQRGDASYTHEIIEFPVVLVDVASCAVVGGATGRRRRRAAGAGQIRLSAFRRMICMFLYIYIIFDR